MVYSGIRNNCNKVYYQVKMLSPTIRTKIHNMFISRVFEIYSISFYSIMKYVMCQFYV